MDSLIKFYFTLGFQQLEILTCLAVNHDITISRRTPKRRLRGLHLFRRTHFTNIVDIYKFIEENIKNHGQLYGYRWMHLRCLQNNITVTQDVVRLLLHIIDPIGVDTRSRRRLRRRQYQNKGPNFLWHTDCYDKLKPFGICISGCIDGFSRRIMWLRAGQNSNDPKVICRYYLDTIEVLGRCPQTLRADLGTENVNIERAQEFLRNTGRTNRSYSLPPFIYGTSPSNQRIEAWWSILRKHHAQFWLNLLHSLKDDGLFSGSFLDKSLIQFWFLRIIQDELDTVVLEWNMHRITSSRNTISPQGRPFIMYHLPQIYGTSDYVCAVENGDIMQCNELANNSTNIPCDSDVYELAILVMYEKRLTWPGDEKHALELYTILRREFLLLLN